MALEDSYTIRKSTICRIVVELAAERGYAGPVPPDSLPLREIGFDSLLTIQLVAALQDELELDFPDSALNVDSFATIESMMRLVEGLQ